MADGGFPTDITGYGRKMGRNAGMTATGKLDGVFRINNKWFPAGTISARTMNPSSGESNGGRRRAGDYWSKPRDIDQHTTYYGADEPGTLKVIHPELWMNNPTDASAGNYPVEGG